MCWCALVCACLPALRCSTYIHDSYGVDVYLYGPHAPQHCRLQNARARPVRFDLKIAKEKSNALAS